MLFSFYKSLLKSLFLLPSFVHTAKKSMLIRKEDSPEWNGTSLTMIPDCKMYPEDKVEVLKLMWQEVEFVFFVHLLFWLTEQR